MLSLPPRTLFREPTLSPSPAPPTLRAGSISSYPTSSPSSLLCHLLCLYFYTKPFENYLFIFGCTGSFGCMRAFSGCSAQAPHCSGFVCRAQLPCPWASVGCGTRASLFHDTWDLSGPGIEPLYPASAGRSSTTRLSGKSLLCLHFGGQSPSSNVSLMRKPAFIFHLSLVPVPDTQ